LREVSVRTFFFSTFAIFLFCGMLAAQIKPEWKDVIGTWEGDTTCVTQPPSCTDGHNLYRVKPDKDDPDKLTLETFKMANNRPEFTGNLTCKYSAEDKVLTCPGPGRALYTFTVGDGAMDGQVTTGKEKTVLRKIALKKK
jgi:hypothetical protein